MIKDNVGGEVAVSAIRESYPREVGIKVTKQGVLEEITSCFEKRKDNGKAGRQMNCPKSIMNSFRNNVCNKKGQCRKTVKIIRLNQCQPE